MRTIKYRAWDKEKKYMSPLGQLNEMKSVLIYVPEQIDEEGNIDWNGDIVPMEKVELMQFTGLLDKNGVEIYENDIVKLNTNHVVQVVWFDQDAMFGVRGKDKDRNLELGCYVNMEKVGDIYQNPELIN